MKQRAGLTPEQFEQQVQLTALIMREILEDEGKIMFEHNAHYDIRNIAVVNQHGPLTVGFYQLFHDDRWDGTVIVAAGDVCSIVPQCDTITLFGKVVREESRWKGSRYTA